MKRAGLYLGRTTQTEPLPQGQTQPCQAPKPPGGPQPPRCSRRNSFPEQTSFLNRKGAKASSEVKEGGCSKSKDLAVDSLCDLGQTIAQPSTSDPQSEPLLPANPQILSSSASGPRLERYFRLPLAFTTLTFFKITRQLFCRISLNYDLSNISL